MPWFGTGQGADAIIKTFADVGRFWNVDSFAAAAIFGEGDKVAVFGRLTYTSTRLHKTVTTPFAILCRLKGGKVEYMQFMEDTFCNILHCLQLSVGGNVEIPERSQWRRNRDLARTDSGAAKEKEHA
jgi:ketosteroid isomerase-like protein